MTKPTPAPPQGKIHHIAGLIAWIGILAVMPFVANLYWNHAGVIIGLSGVYLVIAIVLRSRLIMGVLAGVLLGLMFDNGVKGGTAESQAWETVGHLAVGAIIGVIAGLVWEGAAADDEPTRTKPKRRR